MPAAGKLPRPWLSAILGLLVLGGVAVLLDPLNPPAVPPWFMTWIGLVGSGLLILGVSRTVQKVAAVGEELTAMRTEIGRVREAVSVRSGQGGLT